jgi:hypothetical protein
MLKFVLAKQEQTPTESSPRWAPADIPCSRLRPTAADLPRRIRTATTTGRASGVEGVTRGECRPEASGGSRSRIGASRELVTLLFAAHDTGSTALGGALELLAISGNCTSGSANRDEVLLGATAAETSRVRPVIKEVGRVLSASVEVAGTEYRRVHHFRRHIPCPVGSGQLHRPVYGSIRRVLWTLAGRGGPGRGNDAAALGWVEWSCRYAPSSRSWLTSSSLPRTPWFRRNRERAAPIWSPPGVPVCQFRPYRHSPRRTSRDGVPGETALARGARPEPMLGHRISCGGEATLSRLPQNGTDPNRRW